MTITIMDLLRLDHIVYNYENKFPALRDVSLTVNKGEKIAVLGNNGAGKSTFFLCCNGVLRPQSGSITLRGKKISNSKDDITLLRKSVGLVFQEPDSQIIAGTVEDEISFGPMNLGLNHNQVKRRVSDALSNMHLTGYEKRAPQYLSGGEKKRVTIADILAMEPDIILLDEPTASLDPENVLLLEQTLHELNRSGIAVVISTHDVDFAYRFADRAVVFSQGCVIADTVVCDVFSNDSILKQAGLDKPIIFAVTEIIDKCINSNSPQIKKPRTISEFQIYINSILN